MSLQLLNAGRPGNPPPAFFLREDQNVTYFNISAGGRKTNHRRELPAYRLPQRPTVLPKIQDNPPLETVNPLFFNDGSDCPNYCADDGKVFSRRVEESTKFQRNARPTRDSFTLETSGFESLDHDSNATSISGFG